MTTTTTTSTTPQSPKRQIPDRPSRVLVADDEFLIAAELTTQLAQSGYTTVGPVGTGADAIHLARTARPDLALLDIRMPGGDGLSVARVLISELSIPVVMLTAYGDQEFVRDADEAGVFGYLIKPAEAVQLRAAIEVAWGRYRQLADECADRQDLERRLAERRIVEQAKWVLVERAGMDEPRALRTLQTEARRNRERLVAVAERVIANGAAAVVPEPPRA